MVFPYDNRRGGRSSRSVPLEVARQLERQRDEMFAEVQKLRREADRLRTANESALSQNEQLARRVTQAEREARQLREAIAAQDAINASAKADEETEQVAVKAAEQAAEQVEADEQRAQLIAQLNSRIDELTSDLERVRSRAERTVSKAQRDERVRLLSGLGTVLDSIDRGLDMEASGPWRQGLEGIRSQLIGFLRAEGATLVGSVGERMDPKLHEAVGVDESEEFDAGEIVSVVRHGLELEDGTLVRPAQVIVAS
jgi:molecular chaperone GrpE